MRLNLGRSCLSMRKAKSNSCQKTEKRPEACRPKTARGYRVLVPQVRLGERMKRVAGQHDYGGQATRPIDEGESTLGLCFAHELRLFTPEGNLSSKLPLMDGLSFTLP